MFFFKNRTRNKILLITAALCILLLVIVGAVSGGSPSGSIEQLEDGCQDVPAFNLANLTTLYDKVLTAEATAFPVETELKPRLETIQGEVVLHSLSGKQTILFEKPAVEANSRIRTGSDGEAKLTWPDGSSILIEPDTIFYLKESKGIYTVSGNFSGKNSREVSCVELLYVNLVLEQGKIFGSLVPEDQVNQGSMIERDQKVRMEVEMPLGVAGIRGTIWMNAVEEDRAVTSVLSGLVEVSAGGVSVAVKPGKTVTVDSETPKPGKPVDMSIDDLEQWRNARSWVGDVKSSSERMPGDVIDRLENLPENSISSDNLEGSAPGGSTEAPGQAQSTPGLSGNTPGQGGTAPPGLSGSTPGQSGNTPGQSGSAPGQSGGSPGNSGSAPGNSGGSSGGDSSPGNSGSAPGQNK